MKFKILFLIHDLGHGGAEKVLVNLVNNMNSNKFDITVMALFGGGVNEQFLKPHIRYRCCFRRSFRGNSHVMKLLSPDRLHRWLVKEKYDIEVSYLEGPSARIVSGCPDTKTKLVSWIHIEQKSIKRASASFRSYREAIRCYTRFDKTVCVSNTVKKDFLSLFPSVDNIEVLYNTNESAIIVEKAREEVTDIQFDNKAVNIIGVGKLLENKGFDRYIRIHKKLIDGGYRVHSYILGEGPLRSALEKYIADNKLNESFTLLGYHTNPYKYVSRCDLFVCASHAEGFSTAATEALIVGTPVCTVDVSGMKEMLGENNEYGVVTDNDEEALYQGIKQLIDSPELLEHYRKQARLRGKSFSTENTVKAVEDMLSAL